jgi:hypothetical protein
MSAFLLERILFRVQQKEGKAARGVGLVVPGDFAPSRILWGLRQKGVFYAKLGIRRRRWLWRAHGGGRAYKKI